ncbi:hypothetical protein ATCV1_z160L [Acanthocystis turfacea chlorella virus 1]|uniref:Uncharacterized protein z160L n=1 Tax=Chlorovirus heliozoae TaxID=322019 RepID=A7K8C0_9PHYC|nr:hypothetical protein ATCV1_z160L [Acanthocystis turfacea chlorella virus 1]ABT16294.1 hypothetical protein ATCV1_z160L [Acanthocystis turfacea chlorella virus 1]
MLLSVAKSALGAKFSFFRIIIAKMMAKITTMAPMVISLDIYIYKDFNVRQAGRMHCRACQSVCTQTHRNRVYFLQMLGMHQRTLAHPLRGISTRPAYISRTLYALPRV